MTEKEKILKKLLAESKITFEEMLILQQKEIQIIHKEKTIDWVQPYNPFKLCVGTPDWTLRPELLPRYNNTLPCNYIAIL